jgi:CHAD domain-containing protein
MCEPQRLTPPLENDTAVLLLAVRAREQRRASRVLEDLTHAFTRARRALEVVLRADLLRNSHALSERIRRNQSLVQKLSMHAKWDGKTRSDGVRIKKEMQFEEIDDDDA